jgi:hypothetical protein
MNKALETVEEEIKSIPELSIRLEENPLQAKPQSEVVNEVTDIATNAQALTKKRREMCPRGTRKHPKTGKCEPYDKDKNVFITPTIQVPTIQAPKPLEQSPLVESKSETKKRKTPCPRGTRKHPKTGKCEPYDKDKNVFITPAIQAPVEKPVIEMKPSSDKVDEKDLIAPEEPEVNPLIEPPPTSSETFQELEPTLLDAEVDKVLTQPMSSIPAIQNYKNVVLDNILAAVPKTSNNYLRQKEKIEYESTKLDTTNEYGFLYPDQNDPNFAVKIAKRKEFNDFQYDGSIKSIKDHADFLCKAQFELMPHQLFVKNFLSFQTPYNSLLLYHGLGTGKTCSSIGIAEEMRSYMKQMGIRKRIIVVASPNVQQNFRVQLFNENSLVLKDGLWTIQSCAGEAFIKEINPTNLKDVPKDRVISQIKGIINQYYVFMGYTELANYVAKKTAVPLNSGYSAEDQRKMETKKIQEIFDNRLIIIDEVHNIRLTDENKDWKTAKVLTKLAKYCDSLRFLLLSATPMYNSHKEIIWLVNLMNMNDGRGTITEGEVFDKTGAFIPAKLGPDGKIVQEGGRELLHRKMIGYISYIRGENPYTFPYRVYPADFAPEHTFTRAPLVSSESPSILQRATNAIDSMGESIATRIGTAVGLVKPQEQILYPNMQLNGKAIDISLNHIPVYLTEVGDYQEKAYRLIINTMRKEMSENFVFEEMDRFGFRRLKMPLEALNMVYPSAVLDEGLARGKMADIDRFDDFLAAEEDDEEDVTNPLATIVGKRGLNSVMNYVDETKSAVPRRYNFDYKPEILESYGRIFSPAVIGSYSAKISKICEIIRASTGIVLVYSQYIDGGVVPLALALEEMGFTRFGSATQTSPLFKAGDDGRPIVEPLDAVTMKPRSELPEGAKFSQAKYVMITGQKEFSPQNAEDVKYVVSNKNANGELVKVILISKAGSEGLDFKCIRQVHLLEPWYNMNRVEQTIGRGVRNLSHCSLPFEKRNVEIYLHGTMLKVVPTEESADLYLYRFAERKAVQIGRVTRLLKEVAVDCLLNIGQTNFTIDKLSALAANQKIDIELSTGAKRIQYKIGDRPYTDICDYMDSCDFKCNPTATIGTGDIIRDTYNDDFVNINHTRIADRLRQLFKEKAFYKRLHLINAINIVKQYPVEQIYSTLTHFIKNKNEYLTDRYGRSGNLVNRDDVYAFQPVEINDESISLYERETPIDFKNTVLKMEVPKEFQQVTEAALEDELSPRGNLESQGTIEDRYTLLLRDLNTDLLHATTSNKITKGEKDWYKQASQVVDILQTKHDLGFNEIKRHLARHMIDMLSWSKKLLLISFMYSKVRDPGSEVETLIKTYLDEKILTAGDRTGVILTKADKWTIFIKSAHDPTLWTEAESEEIRLFKNALDAKFIVNPYANMVGFINSSPNDKGRVFFRVKDMTQSHNNTGTRIDSQIRADVIKRLNFIIQEQYTDQTSTGINQTGFCVMLELLLRQMSADKVDGKSWFFDPETTAYLEISKYHRKT